MTWLAEQTSALPQSASASNGSPDGPCLIRINERAPRRNLGTAIGMGRLQQDEHRRKARKTKSLARNNKTGSGFSGSALTIAGPVARVDHGA
jgi:hypothetical protein